MDFEEFQFVSLKPTPDSDLVTVTMAASRIQVSTSTIRKWIREGRIASIKFSRRCVRVSVLELERYLTECTRPASERFRTVVN